MLEIGPESYDFFNLKPFAGFEITSDSANYFLVGIYMEDNIGTLFTGDASNFIFTPSFFKHITVFLTSSLSKIPFRLEGPIH